MAKEPGYCLHKASGRAYVNLGGRVIYLGKYGTAESRLEYDRIKAEWLANRHSSKFFRGSGEPTMADVCLAYLDHAEKYYPTGNEFLNIRSALRPVSDFYAKIYASKFGPLEFRTIRDWWIKTPIEFSRKGKSDKPPKFRSRKTINEQMSRIVRMFKWAVSQGMVRVEVYQTLKCVEPLKRGRCDAVESKPIQSVKPELVEATLPHLTQVLADMVRFQMLVGCRPGEMVKITPGMVDRSGSVWTIELAEHKTAYRGKSRTIYVGPKAQAVLRPYLLRDANDHCFSPQESEQQRLAAKHAARKTRLSCGNRPGTNIARRPMRKPGTRYCTGSYAKAIKYACRRAKLEHWHPNQLRHTAATEIRKQFGIDAASVILGHSGLDVTQVYAEQDKNKAIEVAMKIG